MSGRFAWAGCGRCAASIACSCSSGSQSQLTADPRPGSQHRFVLGLGYDFHSPPVVSPPIVSFSPAAARAFPEQRCTVRAPRSAQGAWPLSARVSCAALCCSVRRGTVQRRERAGQHRERVRAVWRVPAPLRLNLHRRRLSYQRHAQRRHATRPSRRFSCSAIFCQLLHQVTWLSPSSSDIKPLPRIQTGSEARGLAEGFGTMLWSWPSQGSRPVP
jgi:hypothetical protein